jgi:hypothetical protein
MPFAIQPTVEQLQEAQPGGLGKVLEAALQGYSAYQTAQQAKQKRQSDKIDMYGKLREIGLSPKDAYDRTLVGTGIPIPAETQAEVEKKAKLLKTQAETQKIQAETEQIGKGGVLKPGQRIKRRSAKNNAIQQIRSKFYGRDKDAALAGIIDDFKTSIDVNDPEIQQALEETYGENGGGFGRAAGVMGRILTWPTSDLVTGKLFGKKKKKANPSRFKIEVE